MRMVYEKYSAVDDLLKSDVRSLLDVGCRDAILRKHIRPQIEYTGVDIVPGPGVDKVANIEDGLPFADREFDAVVALDLLEHTNNIWFAFDELVRVARRQVVIVLPNVYHWSSRVRFSWAGRWTNTFSRLSRSSIGIVGCHHMSRHAAFALSGQRCTASTPRSRYFLAGGGPLESIGFSPGCPTIWPLGR